MFRKVSNNLNERCNTFHTNPQVTIKIPQSALTATTHAFFAVDVENLLFSCPRWIQVLTCANLFEYFTLQVKSCNYKSVCLKFISLRYGTKIEYFQW